METRCLHCDKVVQQTPGKRKKEYCSSTCRTVYWKKKNYGDVPKRKVGRPKKIIFPSELPNPLPRQFSGIIEGPIKEVVQEVSKENAKLGIQAMISAIKAEKIPKERDTINGRKSWALDQRKRIQELESKLK